MRVKNVKSERLPGLLGGFWISWTSGMSWMSVIIRFYFWMSDCQEVQECQEQ